MLDLASQLEIRTHREKLKRATVPGLVALDRLPVVTGPKRAASVRATDVFQQPVVGFKVPLNRKTTHNEVQPLRVAGLEPTQDLLPRQGVESYVIRPRRDPPDVAHLVMRDGRERWVIQEGHTRLAAALLRGEARLRARVWEFEQNAAGSFDPIPRGLHQHGVYRDKLVQLAEWDESAHPRNDKGQFGEGGGGEAKTDSPEASHARHQKIGEAIEFFIKKYGVDWLGHLAKLSPVEAARLGLPLPSSLAALPYRERLAFLLDWDEGSHPRDETGRFAGGSVSVGGREVGITKSDFARAHGSVLVPVDIAKFDAAWQQEKGFHVTPGGAVGVGSGAIAGRYARVGEFLQTAASMEASDVDVRADGRVGFQDGRHRLAYLRDQGVTHVPVAMSKKSLANAKRHGLVAKTSLSYRERLTFLLDKDEHGYGSYKRGEGHDAASDTLTAGAVGDILAAQHEQVQARAREREAGSLANTTRFEAPFLQDRFVASEKFRLIKIPVDAASPIGNVRPGATSKSTGPIIVDANKGSFGRGMYGAPPRLVVLDGKHRLAEAKARGADHIWAYVGDKAEPHLHLRQDLDWDESLHPRDDHGRFGEGGGESSEAVSVRQFKGNEGYAWHERPEMETYAKELPPTLVEAVDDYASFSYGEMNGLLRGTREPDADRLKEVERKIAAVDTLIREHGYELHEPVEVQRAAYVPGLTYDTLKAMEGQTIEEKGFTSTMLGNPGSRLDSYVVGGMAESLYKRHEGKIYEHQDEVGAPMRVSIVLPAGTKVAPVETLRRIDYDYPKVQDPAVFDHPEWLTKDDGTPNGLKTSDYTIRDYTAKPTIKTERLHEDSQRSEAEILLGSGAQFRVVSVKRGDTPIRSSDSQLKPVHVIDVRMEYVGGGSSEGTKKLRHDLEWDESLHPRDHGKFAETEGGSGDERVGLRPATEDDAARMKALRVPPKWTNVQLSHDPEADLQATGTDIKGRTQYLYSAKHSERAAAEKFERLKEFNKALPGLRQQIAKDIHDNSLSSVDRESALVLHLIDKTGFRIGSDAETGGDKKAYGATTLRAGHVRITGDKVSFQFTGKKGVDIAKTITDPVLAQELGARKATVGRGPLFSETSDAKVRDYLHDRGGDFKVKDLRTWHGTNKALETIAKMSVPKTEAAFKKAQREVSVAVAKHLGNTPAVAKSSYIDPAVWSKWKAA